MQMEVERNIFMGREEQFMISNYLEQIKQFGFLVLFTNAFPLAAIFCFFANLLEIRIKMNQLFYYTRRPDAKGASNIGAWTGIVEFLGLLSIPTNFASIYFSNGGGYGP